MCSHHSNRSYLTGRGLASILAMGPSPLTLVAWIMDSPLKALEAWSCAPSRLLCLTFKTIPYQILRVRLGIRRQQTDLMNRHGMAQQAETLSDLPICWSTPRHTQLLAILGLKTNTVGPVLSST